MTSIIMQIWAMGSPQPGTQPQGMGLGAFVPMILIFAIFYFMLIRPQQRREKERRAMIANLKAGDRVVFAGGILGVITNVKDNILTIKVADNVKLDVTRWSVTQLLNKDETPAETADVSCKK